MAPCLIPFPTSMDDSPNGVDTVAELFARRPFQHCSSGPGPNFSVSLANSTSLSTSSKARLMSTFTAAIPLCHSLSNSKRGINEKVKSLVCLCTPAH